jgi:hypothetical protein
MIPGRIHDFCRTFLQYPPSSRALEGGAVLWDQLPVRLVIGGDVRQALVGSRWSANGAKRRELPNSSCIETEGHQPYGALTASRTV